jgi:hypothetical protein
MMVILFWIITFILSLSALCFIIPWVSSQKGKLFFILILGIGSYGLYHVWGSSSHLKNYYDEESIRMRANLKRIQPLLNEFKKQEISLKMHLEEFPEDALAECRLLDILAIKALQNHQQAKALQYWELAIKKLPNKEENKVFKSHIEEMVSKLKKP